MLLFLAAAADALLLFGPVFFFSFLCFGGDSLGPLMKSKCSTGPYAALACHQRCERASRRTEKQKEKETEKTDKKSGHGSQIEYLVRRQLSLKSVERAD